MLKTVIWGTAAVTVATAALFIPIHPASLGLTATPDGAAAARHSPTATLSRPIELKASRSVDAPDVVAPAAAVTPPPASPGVIPATLPASEAPSPFAAAPALAKPSRTASIATIRALQRELQRLGCYQGPIDGDWGPASRYAAALFTKAANAALPIDQPDVVLLSLARHHATNACGSEGASRSLTTAATRATAPALTAPVTVANADTASDTSVIAPRAAGPRRAPRIVRANGTLAGSNIIEIRPATQPGLGGTRMSLGVAVPSDDDAAPANPITRYSEPRRDAAAARRIRQRGIERRNQRRSNRAARRRWKREVFRAVDLSGN